MVSLLAIIATVVLLASALLWRAFLRLRRPSARLLAIFRRLLNGGALLNGRRPQ
jgi:hypothetical protein